MSGRYRCELALASAKAWSPLFALCTTAAISGGMGKRAGQPEACESAHGGGGSSARIFL